LVVYIVVLEMYGHTNIKFVILHLCFPKYVRRAQTWYNTSVFVYFFCPR